MRQHSSESNSAKFNPEEIELMFEFSLKCTRDQYFELWKISPSYKVINNGDRTTCQWNNDWSDDLSNFECKRKSRAFNLPCNFCSYIGTGIACEDPPKHPADTDLESLWDGQPTPLGSSVQYKCKRGGALVSNININTFLLNCDSTSGTFTEPVTWPKCQRCERLL